MPIQLTTPHYDEPQVRINVIGIDLGNKEIVLTVQYGDTSSSGAWVPSGDHAAETHTIKNWELETDGEVELVAADSVYDDLVSAAIGLCTFTDKSSDPNYIKVIVVHPTHGNLDLWVEKSYAGTKRQFYQWLLDEAIYAGSIV